LKSFLKKLKLVEGSKLGIASKFAEEIPLRGNFTAMEGERPGASGTSKLASESLMSP
jgi:hypothetical protein